MTQLHTLQRNALHAAAIAAATTFLAAPWSTSSFAGDASISATSTRPGVRRMDGDSETWKYTTPTALDTITWISGPNTCDTNTFRHANLTETKFTMPGATAKVLTGFTFLDGPGVLGSSCITNGTGRSWLATNWVGTNHYCDWQVAASGTLGNQPRAFWSASARGHDPYMLLPEHFADIPTDFYDLYIAVGIDAGASLGAHGRLDLNVWYDSAGFGGNMLRIVTDVEGINVASEPDPGLRFFMLDSIEEGPTMEASDEITLEDLKSLLDSDMLPDRTLDAPLYIGIVWEDIPVPTVDLGNGAVAKIRVETQARDADANDFNPRCGVPWLEDFDPYASPEPLLPHGCWEGFNGNSAFDGIVQPNVTLSLPNALDVQPNTNVVHSFEGVDAGQWHFRTWQLIPFDFQSGGNQPEDGSYIILFDQYEHNGPQHPGAIIQADSNTQSVRFFCGSGTSTVDVPYIVDQWVPIDVVVDLENDHTVLFYNEQPVCEYQWTAGAFGNGNGQPTIAAVDLFARGSSSIFYDDMMLVPMQPAKAPLITIDAPFGSITGGSITDLEQSDDSYLTMQSQFGFSATRANFLRLQTESLSPLDQGSMSVFVESGLNHPGGVMEFSLFDVNAQRFQVIATDAIGLDETMFEYRNIDASQFVDPNTTVVQTRIEQAMVATFTPMGFTSSIDLHEITIDPN